MRAHFAIFAALSLTGWQASAIVVSFWPTKVPAPPDVTIEDHPCGPVITMDTDVVPSNVPWLEPDLVREIDANGNTLRSWRVPIDRYPVALEGDTLVVGFGSSFTSVLKISLDGKISEAPRPPHASLESTSCPDSLGEFHACAVVNENPKRFLAYPLVCT